LERSTFRPFDFAAGTAGTLTATANWTFSSNDVDIFVTSGNTCQTFSNAGVPTGAGCTILCQDIAVGGTRASCTFSATSGNARLLVVNFGPTAESGTYLITVTR
jgi:hypothetical protein